MALSNSSKSTTKAHFAMYILYGGMVWCCEVVWIGSWCAVVPTSTLYIMPPIAYRTIYENIHTKCARIIYTTPSFRHINTREEGVNFCVFLIYFFSSKISDDKTELRCAQESGRRTIYRQTLFIHYKIEHFPREIVFITFCVYILSSYLCLYLVVHPI